MHAFQCNNLPVQLFFDGTQMYTITYTDHMIYKTPFCDFVRTKYLLIAMSQVMLSFRLLKRDSNSMKTLQIAIEEIPKTLQYNVHSYTLAT